VRFLSLGVDRSTFWPCVIIKIQTQQEVCCRLYVFFLRHRPACLIFFSFDFFYWFSHFQPLVLTLFYYYFILSNFIHHHFISFELDFIIYFSLFFCRFIMILNKLFVIWLCLILWVLLFFLSYTWIKNSFIKNKVIKTSRVHKPDYWFDMLTWVNWELAFIFFLFAFYEFIVIPNKHPKWDWNSILWLFIFIIR
jgi:hypothetical protein